MNNVSLVQGSSQNKIKEGGGGGGWFWDQSIFVVFMTTKDILPQKGRGSPLFPALARSLLS